MERWNEVTANDFEFTFQKMATPSVAATNAWLFDGIIENFSEALYDQGKKPEEIGVHAIDEDTLEIKLSTRHLTSWNWFPHQLIR